MITRGGMTVSHDIQEPGWRWSVHIRPLVKTEWCQVHHTGVVLRGQLAVLLEDGTEFEVPPMSLIDIPAGHDAWVVGDEPVETIAWAGVREWLAPLDPLADRILATLVFTDLVDSTGKARAVGSTGWTELVARYEQDSRDIVSHHRGRTIKMTGDGILATFDGAARAARCAIRLRDAADALGLATRSAVHTGEVTVVEDDIHGLAIHEASRMLALAGPGEILLSSDTVGLTRDAGLELEDRGEHQLRGIDTPIRVYALR